MHLNTQGPAQTTKKEVQVTYKTGGLLHAEQDASIL